MIDILIFFIAASLLLYILLGGSDFGAGILELLPAKRLREKQKHVITEAMGPVWEANHIWLILIVVILFMGFPRIFTVLMISLHLPFLALLVGVVVRGTMFTFRHYDSIQTPRSQGAYTWLFGLSSLWSALWLGIIAASLNRGLIDPEATGFREAYIDPWWGGYPLSVGVFVACIFAFLACVFLIGETEDPILRRRFRRWGGLFNGLVVAGGGLVFLTSLAEPEPLAKAFLAHPSAIGAMVVASLLFVVLWAFVVVRRPILARVVASGQVALILLGWWLLYAPNAVITVEGPLSFEAEVAPEATQRQLVIALLVGSLFIFPAMIFLFTVFKRRRADA